MRPAWEEIVVVVVAAALLLLTLWVAPVLVEASGEATGLIGGLLAGCHG